MKLAAMLLMSALALTPGVAFAHGEAPKASHGGLVQEAQEFWIELVVSGTDVTVYVLDDAQKPVPPSQVSGSATVLAGGKSYKVDLSPAASNSLQGKLPVAATGRVVAVVALKIADKVLSARFTSGT